uniref:Uncharacterized protein n=1 Tax=Sphaerodactylus townsendi TaxID=933632 RepID=A0ACB8ER93_9SAUR
MAPAQRELPGTRTLLAPGGSFCEGSINRGHWQARGGPKAGERSPDTEGATGRWASGCGDSSLPHDWKACAWRHVTTHVPLAGMGLHVVMSKMCKFHNSDKVVAKYVGSIMGSACFWYMQYVD